MRELQELLYRVFSPIISRKIGLSPGRALVNQSTVLIEQELFAAVNIDRQRKHLSCLSSDARLVDLARDHSANMAKKAFFDHINPAGLDSNARAKNYGLQGAGENLALVPVRKNTLMDWSSIEEIARYTHHGWMHSAGHKKNILLPRYTRMGLGVIYNGHVHYLITQNFF